MNVTIWKGGGERSNLMSDAKKTTKRAYYGEFLVKLVIFCFSLSGSSEEREIILLVFSRREEECFLSPNVLKMFKGCKVRVIHLGGGWWTNVVNYLRKMNLFRK